MKHLLTGEQTERLDFGLLEPHHYDAWLPLFKAPRVAEFLGLDTQLSARQLGELWFDKCFARYRNNNGGMNVLVDRKIGRMVGQCGLLIQEIEGERFMEIGYSVLPEFWGLGYATEAAQKCKEYAFAHNYWDALISMVHVENTASAAVAQRNGLQLWKSLPNYKDCPVNIFRITREAYLGGG